LYILPETISALPSLKKLILDDNPLKEIPLSLLECPILEMISIRNTFINVEPLFEKLLKLNNNKIEILY
jgi:Leucine-rich repeat (LRR) protein